MVFVIARSRTRSRKQYSRNCRRREFRAGHEPGTTDRPVKTVSRAAELAMFNRRNGTSTNVTIRPGTYREFVQVTSTEPETGGSISFRRSARRYRNSFGSVTLERLASGSHGSTGLSSPLAIPMGTLPPSPREMAGDFGCGTAARNDFPKWRTAHASALAK